MTMTRGLGGSLRKTPTEMVVDGRFPFRFAIASLAIVTTIVAAMVLYVFYSYGVMRRLHAEGIELQKLAITILYLEEVLTMSARMAAVTGDPAWNVRYRQHEPTLDGVIARVRQLVDDPVALKAITETDTANATLVTMEYRALEWVREGRLAEAQALLFSDDYALQKDHYRQGLQELTASIDQQAGLAVAAQWRYFFLVVVSLIAVLLVLLSAWVAVLAVLRRWQRALLESTRQLTLQATELSEFNQTLDQRVAERTAELREANRVLTLQQQEMARLLEEVRISKANLERQNKEMVHRGEVMQSLLEDLHAAKDRIEQQAATLHSANEKLQSLAALKDEFVAKVSHELRTPLTSIKEGLSLLLDRALGAITPDQEDFIKTMDGDIDRLADLINNMLDISKIEAGRMRLMRSRLALPPLIQSLIRSYQPILGSRVVQTEVAGAVPPVFGDSNRLLQVFTNLLSNALKFTPDGGAITFHMEQRNGAVAVAVKDTGPGIAPHDLPKLFQKFSQVGGHRHGAPRGTGLGLVVCKELTELHGGRIEVTSEVGRGTTFTVLLPAYTDQIALAESFKEQLELGAPGEDEAGTLITVHVGDALNSGQAPDARQAALEHLAQEARQYLHRGDIVLPLEPSWVVVLAIVDERGISAIATRLRDKMKAGHAFRFGAATYGRDGSEAEALFRHATSPQGQLALAPKPAGANSMTPGTRT